MTGYGNEIAWWYSPLRPYLLLLHLYADGRLSATELVSIYLPVFQQETQDLDDEQFHLLNGIFTALDSYEEDEDREPFYIGETELRDAILPALQRLEERELEDLRKADTENSE